MDGLPTRLPNIFLPTFMCSQAGSSWSTSLANSSKSTRHTSPEFKKRQKTKRFRHLFLYCLLRQMDTPFNASSSGFSAHSAAHSVVVWSTQTSPAWRIRGKSSGDCEESLSGPYKIRCQLCLSHPSPSGSYSRLQFVAWRVVEHQGDRWVFDLNLPHL